MQGAKITLMQTQGQSNSYSSSPENGHSDFKLEYVQSKYNSTLTALAFINVTSAGLALKHVLS